jgi:hypothetical protein
MGRKSRWSLLGALLAPALAATTPVAASSADYGSPDDLWERYCRMVGARDEVEVLACYHEELRGQLTSDKTAAGRARLSVHMSEMFELLQRDYDYRVVEEKEESGKATFKLEFKNRKKGDQHFSTVTFVESEGRWWIQKPPELPGMLTAASGSFTMVAGVVIALGAVAFLVKKALG